jgi:hypothetical protein
MIGSRFGSVGLPAHIGRPGLGSGTLPDTRGEIGRVSMSVIPVPLPKPAPAAN